MLRFLRKKLYINYPEKLTVNDCLLLYQMGYEVTINNGQVTKITKRKH